MTIDTAPASLAARYGGMWRRVPRELGYLLPILPITAVTTGTLWGIFGSGIGLLIAIVGIVVVLAALFVARGLGMFELLRLSASGQPPITPPTWDRVAPTASTWAKLIAPIVDGHYWLYLLWGTVVGPIVGGVTWALTVAWCGSALVALLSPIWYPLAAAVSVPGALRAALSLLPLALVGIALVAALPFVTRAMTVVNASVARGMLGAFESEALRAEVTAVSASRTAAVAAEGSALRRLERDIHDGPQQRLIRMQMDLAAADRRLDAADPEAARALIAGAQQQARDALEELRALSRGFAPPILLDRGLEAALRSLAVRSAIPIELEVDLPADAALPDEIARNAYFIAAEATTNAAKHSGAPSAVLRVFLRRSAADGSTWLEVEVTDAGRGGAVPRPDSGLAGLDERVRGLGGTLSIDSPQGGPTTLRAQLPVT